MLKGSRVPIHVRIRPGVKSFLLRMAKKFELVVFTASLDEYGQKVIEHLDPSHVVDFHLFRNSCFYIDGHFVKDLKRLGRDLKDVILLDVYNP
jgi:TFIIF-interacting CTD phosphatase-like protein